MLITDREQQKRYKQKNNKPLRQRAPKSSPPHKQKHLLQSHPNPGAFMTTQSHQRPGPSQQYDTKTISLSLYSSSSSLNNRGALSRRGRQHYGSRRAFGNLSEQTTPHQDVADQAVNAPSSMFRIINFFLIKLFFYSLPLLLITLPHLSHLSTFHH